MNADRYARVHAVFEAARGLEGAERAALLDETCGDDVDLRCEVEELLAALHKGAFEFSETGIAAARGALEDVLSQACDDREWTPERVGPYRVLRRIAEGGMGVVYEAEQESPRRRIALKIIHPLYVTETRLKRFRQEAELLGRLRHPGIAQIHEAGSYDLGRGPQPYFAMELVEGVDLVSHASETKLPVPARLELVARVCDAVQHAHEMGVIHRDLKPDNVLVDARGRPKVLDFGVARVSEGSTALTTLVTEEGDLLGTIAYMAPEQLAGFPDAITPRADVHALGVIAFELLAGRLPHDVVGLPLVAAMRIVQEAQPPRLGGLRPELKGEVETIVGKALEKEPARRYASAAALAADLRAHLQHRPIDARPPSRVYRVRKFTRRNKALVGGTLATLLAITAGLVVALLFAARANENARQARIGERRATAEVLRVAQEYLNSGDVWRAATLFSRVAGEERRWETELLRRVLPAVAPIHLVAGPHTDWVDDEHLAVPTQDGVVVVEVGTWREVRRDGAPARRHIIARLGAPPLVDVDVGGSSWSLRHDRATQHWICVRDGVETARIPATSGSAFLSPDARRLALHNGTELSVYDPLTGECFGRIGGLQDDSCLWVRFLPGGEQLLTFEASSRLVAVDVDRVQVVRRYESVVSEHCLKGDMSADGKLFTHIRRQRVEVFDLPDESDDGPPTIWHPEPRAPAAVASSKAPLPAPAAEPHRSEPHRYRWAELLRRVFEIDVLHCDHCGGRRKLIAMITHPLVVRRILRHLELPSEPPPIAPARPPPQMAFAF